MDCRPGPARFGKKTSADLECIANINLNRNVKNCDKQCGFAPGTPQLVQRTQILEDELGTFEHRLEELVFNYTDKDFLKRLEHFQNEFLLHRKRIGEMQESIKRHEMRIAAQSLEGEDNSLDVPMVRNHMAFREKMEVQRDIYNNLKKEYFRFLTEFM